MDELELHDAEFETIVFGPHRDPDARLRPDLLDWCDQHIGKVVVSRVEEVRDPGDRRLARAWLAFESAGDLLVYRLRWH